MRYGQIAREIREETRLMERSLARLNALADELERIEDATPKFERVPVASSPEASSSEVSQTVSAPYKILMSVNEASKALGLSRTTVYTLIHRDDFPAIRLGGRTLINVKKLQEWVDNQTNE